MATITAPATAKVIDTTELFENVLGHLGLCDLLRVRGVSQRFKSVVDTSTTLKETLFLVATPASKYVNWVKTDKPGPTLYPPTLTTDPAPVDGRVPVPIVVLHPILRAVPYDAIFHEWRFPRKDLAFIFRPAELMQLPESGLVQNMLISQPPITKIAVQCRANGMEYRAQFQVSTGVTIHHLITGCMKMAVWTDTSPDSRVLDLVDWTRDYDETAYRADTNDQQRNWAERLADMVAGTTFVQLVCTAPDCLGEASSSFLEAQNIQVNKYQYCKTMLIEAGIFEDDHYSMNCHEEARADLRRRKKVSVRSASGGQYYIMD